MGVPAYFLSQNIDYNLVFSLTMSAAKHSRSYYLSTFQIIFTANPHVYANLCGVCFLFSLI